MCCSSPCNLAVALSENNRERIKSIYVNADLIPQSAMVLKCPLGLTPKQAMTLACILCLKNGIYSYTNLTEFHKIQWDIDTTRLAIRDLIKKLNAKHFFDVCKKSRDGILQGMRFKASPKVCQFLTPSPSSLPSAATAPLLSEPHSLQHTPQHTPTASPLLHMYYHSEEGPPATVGILNQLHHQRVKDAIYLKAEQFFKAGQWPHLAASGFDFSAFAAATRDFTDYEVLSKTWHDSLTFADFDAQRRDELRDTNERPIKNFRLWVSGCFRRNGHYPRPQAYRTADEIAKATAEKEQLKKSEAQFHSAFEKWRSSKTQEELVAFAGGDGVGRPSEYLIKERFRLHVWPTLKNSDNEAASDDTALHNT